MKRRSQAGFTLTEMMVVVAIIAVLSTLAIVYISPKTKPIDVSNRFADLVREASREAVTYGTVRADVATAQGSKRRTRIIGSGVASSSPLFTLQRFVEDASPATTGTWVTMAMYQVPNKVFGDSYIMQVGSHAALLASLQTNWSNFAINCFPNGSCDAASLYFQATTGSIYSPDFQSRVSVLPLGTAVYVRNDWN
jgi:prepilin-type N-terminal cleavage/methylation domain-containing protein